MRAVTAVGMGTTYLFLELTSADQNNNYDGFAVRASLQEERRGTKVRSAKSGEPLSEFRAHSVNPKFYSERVQLGTEAITYSIQYTVL